MAQLCWGFDKSAQCTPCGPHLDLDITFNIIIDDVEAYQLIMFWKFKATHSISADAR